MIYSPMRIFSDFKIETSILFEEEITIMETGTLKQLIDKCKVSCQRSYNSPFSSIVVINNDKKWGKPCTQSELYSEDIRCFHKSNEADLLD